MTNLKTLRVLAILEGISYISFAITMPLKYNYDMLLPNKIVGYIHGALFIAYLIWLVLAVKEQKWGFKHLFLGGIASIIPFGTFVADKKLFQLPENQS